MEAPEIAQFARNFAVMVRIHGPDPKSRKMLGHAFHLHQSGNTTLSASGLLLPPGALADPPPIIDHICSIHHHSGAVVITAASVVEPFLTAQQRNNPTQEFSPKVIPGARIDVLVEGANEGNNHDKADKIPYWHPSQLLALVDISASSSALLSLVGDHASWESGWSLSPLYNDPQSKVDVFQRQIGNDNNSRLDESGSLPLMFKLATRIAFLGVSAVDLKDILHIDVSRPQKRGDFLLVMGSPFGVLSPLHFFNSISVGAIANFCSSRSYISSLLVADIRCLPGMEGGPVFDRRACLTGILTRPLRQKGSSSEIQLVITWEAIRTAWSNELKKEFQRSQGEFVERNYNSLLRAQLHSSNNSSTSVECLPPNSDFPCLSKSSFEKVLSSIVLVTVGDGVWASGIVLNNYGLILTNAHILEPWRFGGASLSGPRGKSTGLSVEHGMLNGERERDTQLGTSTNVSSEPGASLSVLSYRNYRKISVRLDHVEPKIWCDAGVVYVSKGPLDVALLQLISVPDQIFPITPEFECPAKGLTVHVIGHGLLGPRSDISPSVSSGVLASVVRIPGCLHVPKSSILETEKRYIPVMLQTTAAVHPGASGGVVVNSDGLMIGLITSNARHGGGTIIPHMNFSIPSPALESIFKFSEKQDLSILEVLDKPNELLSSVWALAPPSPPNLQSPAEKNNNDGRGSRFSKFLSDNHADFTSLVIKDKLPSKI